MNGKKVKRIIVATALIAVLAISGISAYFTDGDTATNTFTVGKIAIDLQEPNWNPANATNITPRQVLRKDPMVANIGVNDAFVFLEVVVPYKKVVIAEQDGQKKETAAYIELFDISHYNKTDWLEMGPPVEDEVAGTATHLFAYVGEDRNMKALAKNSTTSALFEYIQFANIVEDQVQTDKGGTALEEEKLSIEVNAYAIQTDNIRGDLRTPTGVWEVLLAQAPSTAKTGGTEHAETDVFTPTTEP